MTDMPTYRSRIQRIVPRWLRSNIAYKLLYSYAIQLDALADAVVGAVKIRFPGLLADSGQLALIGQDRRLRRYASDTDSTFALRLQQWRQLHQRRGSPFALLRQVGALLDNTWTRLEVWDDSGNMFARSTAGVESVTPGGTWLWDAQSGTKPWRYWLLIQTSSIGPPSAWGSGHWGDGRTWGTNATADTINSIRQAVVDWNSAHGECHTIVIITNAGAWFPPTTSNWDRWANRSPGAAYLQGTRPLT